MASHHLTAGRLFSHRLMTITLIAISVSLAAIAIFFGMRRRAVSVELGSMSTQWIAEHKSAEHTYSER